MIGDPNYDNCKHALPHDHNKCAPSSREKSEPYMDRDSELCHQVEQLEAQRAMLIEAVEAARDALLHGGSGACACDVCEKIDAALKAARGA